MARAFLSIAVLAPVALAGGIAFMNAIGMINGYAARSSQMNDSAVSDIKSMAAQLARIAEQSLHRDEQLLFDDITQRATDPRLLAAAAADEHGKVMFATRFGWTGQDIAEVIEGFSRDLVADAYRQRAAVLAQSDEKIVAMMSFNLPASDQQIRSSRKGLIVVEYDLHDQQAALALDVVKERWPEIVLSLFALLFAVWLSQRWIVQPLSRLRAATRSLAAGDFSATLAPSGLAEVWEITRSFNTMSANLAGNIRQLAEQGQQTQAIIDHVIDGIVTIDPDGMITSFNRAAEKIFRCGRDDVLGQNVQLLVPEYSALGQYDQAPGGRETTGRRANGELFALEVGLSGIAVQARKGYVVAILRDITERKKLDELKDSFTSTVSHELRTPLTVINGAISLLNAGAAGELPSEAKRLVAAAQRNSERLLLLVNDLLDIEKLMADKFVLRLEAVPVATVLNAAMEINCEFGRGRNIEIRQAGEWPHVAIHVDVSRILQVLANLLSNAVKFSPPDSVVEVGGEVVGECVRLFVRDHGEGIPEAFRPLVFERFTRADSSGSRERGGTGLGLAISRELVERMNGRVWFESELGQGTVFFVELPSTREVSAAASAASPAE